MGWHPGEAALRLELEGRFPALGVLCIPTFSIAIRILRCDNEAMTSREFLRRAKDYARRTGQPFRFEPAHGKGSHGRVYDGHAVHHGATG